MRDFCCEFYGLVFDYCAADFYDVGADGAAGTGAVAVGDAELGVFEGCEGGGFGGVEGGVLADLGRGEGGGEDPAVEKYLLVDVEYILMCCN